MTAGYAWIAGLGGHVRVSTHGGQTWDHEVVGAPTSSEASERRLAALSRLQSES